VESPQQEASTFGERWKVNKLLNPPYPVLRLLWTFVDLSCTCLIVAGTAPRGPGSLKKSNCDARIGASILDRILMRNIMFLLSAKTWQAPSYSSPVVTRMYHGIELGRTRVVDSGNWYVIAASSCDCSTVCLIFTGPCKVYYSLEALNKNYQDFAVVGCCALKS
jgi:hypothetical protein